MNTQRIIGLLQILLIKVLKPLFWLIAKTNVKTPPLLPIDRPILLTSATGLAEKIRKGEYSCEEVLNEYISQSKRANKKVNAIVEDRFSEALKEAREVDKLVASKTKTIKQLEEETPLLGVPLSVKESCKVKDLSYAVGSKLRQGMKADRDGAAVTLLREAGAIPLLVSNQPELCMAHETHNFLTGLTKNPYDERRTVGGSSGGEAALISSAGSVIGVGSDLVGSILCPSFFCGIFGHRPTPKVVSVEGHFPGGDHEGLTEHLTVGPMTRYACDLSLMMKVMAFDNAKVLRLDEKIDMKKLKIFYILDLKNSFGIASVDKEIKQVIIDTVNHLVSTYTCHCQEAEFSELAVAPEVSNAVLFNIKNIPDTFSMFDSSNPKERPNLYTEYLKSIFGLSSYSTSPLLLEILKSLNSKNENTEILMQQAISLKKKIQNTLADDGILLCPVYPEAAHYHHQSLLRFQHIVFCALVSSMGLPSTNVPMGLNSKGLPIGFQVIAGPYQDRLCIAVAEELERKFGGWIPPSS